MRATLLSALMYLLILPSPSSAQASLAGLRTLRLTGGVAITLPQAWRRLDAAMESKVNAAMDTIFPKVKDSLFQTALSRGKPVQLLNAIDGDNPVRSLNLNAAPAPGATPATFAAASDDELAKALGPLCETIGQLMVSTSTGITFALSAVSRLWTEAQAALS